VADLLRDDGREPTARPAGADASGEIFRFAAFGAVRHTALAPTAGAVSAAFFSRDQMAFTKKSGHTWLVFPTDVREYTFYVNGEPTTVEVPWDFSSGANENAGSFEDLVIDTYFGSRAAFEAAWDRLAAAHQLVQQASSPTPPSGPMA